MHQINAEGNNKQIYFQKMKISMLSEAGRIHEKCKRIRPLSRNEREKVYASCEMSATSYRKPVGEKKFSPFNTISRQSRNSYLLRVTNQPNTQTNYQVDYSPVLTKNRRSTIDQASFKRIIGPVNQNDYSVTIQTNRDHRCTGAFTPSSIPKPLTAREAHRWRKTHEHMDFTKQINPERIVAHDYLKQMKSTDDSFMLKTLGETTQSNFNNYKRFSLLVRADKAHDFNSDSGHKYLDEVMSREIQPEYDILSNNQEILRKSMRKPRGELRFNLFRNLIRTRVDRADPQWLQTLDYSPKINEQNEKITSIDFNQTTNRRENTVHSKYPIRQSLKPYVPLNSPK